MLWRLLQLAVFGVVFYFFTVVAADDGRSFGHAPGIFGVLAAALVTMIISGIIDGYQWLRDRLTGRSGPPFVPGA